MPGLLRPDLLAGVAVLAAPPTPVSDGCARLGASVAALDGDLGDEEATAAAAAARPADALVVDAARLPGPLPERLDRTWSAVRAAVTAHLLPPAGTGGPVVLVAPRPGAGDHAGALRAGLENLARVLSIEWARHAVRPVAVLPGAETSDDEVADLVAWLVSPAGAYASGCAFTLT